MSKQHPSPTMRRPRRRPAVWLAIAASACVGLAAATTALALTWGAPVDLSVPTSSAPAGAPQITIAPDGAATAVWRRSDGANSIIQTATRPAESDTWGASSDLSATGYDAGQPQIAIAPDGAATAVWLRTNGTNDIVQVATRPAGSNTWGTVSDLSAPGGDANRPQIAIAPDGAATAVWHRSNGTNDIVQAATRPAGSDTWGTASDLSAPGGDARYPQVAVAPDGTATAIWQRDNGSDYIIQTATRPAGSNTWGTASDLSATGHTADSAQIAVAPDGTASAIWVETLSENIIQTATRPAGSNTWGAASDISLPGGDAYAPHVAIAPDGAATAVWYRYNGANYIVQAAMRPAGSNTWGAPADVSAGGASSFQDNVAIAPDGAATAVWLRYDGSDFRIQAATRAAGSNTWGTPSDLSLPGGNAFGPQIAIAADGAATSVWYRSVAADTTIQAATSAPTVAMFPLTVSTAGTGTGTVTSVPGRISCGASCSARFALSSTVTLTATPASGSTFTGWGGACSGTATTCDLTILGSTSATATFTASTTDPASPASPENAPVPSNAFGVPSAKVEGASVITRISVPGPGTITQRGTYGTSSMARELATRTACTTARTAAGAGTFTLTCTLNAAARRARTMGPLRLRVATTFTPTGGTARTTTRTVTFRARHPKLVVTG